MSTRRTSLRSIFGFESLLFVTLALGCSSSSTPNSPGVGGSNSATGGKANSSGGANSTGGSSAALHTGGTPSVATGGAPSAATGGTPSAATGGTPSAATGGTPSAATGGTPSAATGGAPNAGTGGADSAGTGGVGTSATGGTATATSGGAATGGGSSTVVQKDCANMKALTAPLLTDFESYDGTTEAGKWVFSFNGVYPAALYGGPYTNGDGSGAYVLGFVGGAQSSNWAIHAANTTQASVWGGGVGFWLGCFDASTYSGLSFYARGTTPTSKINVSLSMEDTSPPSATNPAGGGTCTMTPSSGCKTPAVDVALPTDWTLVKIPWASFTGGMGLAGTAVTVNGARINALSFGAVMVWQNVNDAGTWAPVPAPFDIQIDNLGFY
jgi:hypothetical protein